MAKTRKKRDKSAMARPVNYTEEDKKLVKVQKTKAKPLPSPSVDFALEVKSADDVFTVDPSVACDTEEVLQETVQKSVEPPPKDRAIEEMKQRGADALKALMGENTATGCGKCGCYDLRDTTSGGRKKKICRNCGTLH